MSTGTNFGTTTTTITVGRAAPAKSDPMSGGPLMDTKRFLFDLRAILPIIAAMLFVTSPQALAQQETVLYSFCSQTNCVDGDEPQSGLVSDKAGNLYGTTYGGGAENLGTVFELSPPAVPGGTWTETVLYSFGAGGEGDGAYPYGGVIFDNAGNLYGTTASTVSNGGGTVFELSPTATPPWTETILYTFGDNAQVPPGPSYPESTLVFDPTFQHLYGTTYLGGAGYGTVFEVSPAGGGSCSATTLLPPNPYYCTLHNFSQTEDGFYPEGTLFLDGDGNLYGTTSLGGVLNKNQEGGGTVFELSGPPDAGGNWAHTLLLSFIYTAKDPGYYPKAGVIAKYCPGTQEVCSLYGTTGGIPGTVFELLPAVTPPWTHKVLYVFSEQGEGEYPIQAGLVSDSAGNLYGTTNSGGTASGNGTVFEVTPSSRTETVLWSFASYSGDGTDPEAGLIFDTAGNLYGTTSQGGANGQGTVFEVTGTPTSTLVASSLNPSIFGQSVMFTATVSSSSGTPAGKVKFMNGSATLGTGTLTGGMATFTTTTLATGTKSITAEYEHDGVLFAGSTSPALSQVVTKATSTLNLTSSGNPSIFEQSVTFTAAVVPEYSGTPAGKVTFKNGSTTLGTVTLVGGVASLTTAALPSGSDTITAKYAGSADFSASSMKLTQTVN